MNKFFQWAWRMVFVMSLALTGCGRAPATLAAEPVFEAPAIEGNFERAAPGRAFVFPRDHGAHPDFQTEWWYVTGNLTGADGAAYGYQLTFFRRAIAAPEQRVERASEWAADQVYLAHFTLTDVNGKAYTFHEKLARGAAGLAGARGEPWGKVWVEDWSFEQTGADAFRLTAQQGDTAVALELKDLKGPVFQGDAGYSQKGPEPGNASYYYSLTRLETTGTITRAGREAAVTGNSWFDHEFSTSALSDGQVGWDWFSIQLDDGSEWMVYEIRRADGSADSYSRGLLIAADGATRLLGKDDFSIEVTRDWKSPHSGGTYPAGWRVTIPAEQLELTLEPRLADQEFNGSFVYWEGAVRAEGTHAGRVVNGDGYVELTGYGQSMENRF